MKLRWSDKEYSKVKMEKLKKKKVPKDFTKKVMKKIKGDK